MTNPKENRCSLEMKEIVHRGTMRAKGQGIQKYTQNTLHII